MEPKTKRRRVVGSKYSKNACRTCRIRRVKCDETRPSCKSCASTRRVCDGYSVSSIILGSVIPSARPLLPSRASSLSSFTSPTSTTIPSSPSCFPFTTTREERNYFQYFTQKLVNTLTRTSPNKDWINLALQFATTESTVHHAITALASVSCMQTGISHNTLGVQPSAIEREMTLKRYCKATASLQRYIGQAINHKASIEPILLCCILFIIYELFQGNNQVALSHLRLGQRAIKGCVFSIHNGFQHQKEKLIGCLSVKTTADILNMFDRLASESIHFGKASLALDYEGLAKTEHHVPAGLRTHFTSAEHAKHVLDCLVDATSCWRADLLRLAEAEIARSDFASYRQAVKFCISQCLSRSIPLHASHPLFRRKTELMRHHEAWLATTIASVEMHDGVARQSLILFQIQQFSSSFLLQTSRETTGTVSNRHKDQFEHILTLATEYILQASVSPDTLRAVLQSSQLNNFEPRRDSVPPYGPLSQPAGLHDPPECQQSFSIEVGILPALYLICLKCRSPTTRRRALTLLRTANRREGLQWSGDWAVFADSMIALEESLAAADSSGHVPERAQFIEVVLEDVAPLDIRMICGRYRHEDDGRLEITDYRGAGQLPFRLQKLSQHVLPFRA